MSTPEYRPTAPECSDQLPAIVDDQAIAACVPDCFSVWGQSRGGFGYVLFVSEKRSGQRYAIKTPAMDVSSGGEIVDEFFKEIEIWIDLATHPNIVTIESVFVSQGRPFVVMEYLAGGNLRQLGRTDVSKAVGVGHQVCLALEFAGQESEFGHFDLKPENILFDDAGVAKVSDFGLSRRMRRIEKRFPELNAGTWPYAAPERLLDHPEDSRSDVYSFGLILYEMIVGKLPFPFVCSNDARRCHRQLRDFYNANESGRFSQSIYYGGLDECTDRNVAVLLSRCLDFFPSQRYASFGELRQDLEHSFGLSPSPASAPLTPQWLIKRARIYSIVGRHDRALSTLNQLLNESPGDANLWVEAGLAAQRGGTGDADEYLARAVEIDPSIEPEIRKRLSSPSEWQDD